MGSMVGTESWRESNQDPVIPPYVSTDAKSRRGRRRLSRRKGTEELLEGQEKQPRKYKPNNTRVRKSKGTIHCSPCGLEGHNKRAHQNEQGSQQSTAGNEQLETTNEHFQAGNEANAADLWYSGDTTRRSDTRYANLAGLAVRVLYPHQTSEAGTSNHQPSNPVHAGATCRGEDV
ncbi:unnamed protein product [Linum tenue]|uniref:Uncharacterized protein n=1 Tax=Linum tenue TaxID=586396 RepID=A0AAV0MJZ2_9ROSI|nr:unnamed protein product [Linum tenue]